MLTHLLIAPIWTILFSYCYGAAWHLFRLGPWGGLFKWGIHTIFWHAVVYLIIVGIAEGYSYQQRYFSAELRMERLERSFSEARLQALRLQLDPHFLFNALNTISAQVSADPRLARRMIEHLGDLLRLSIETQARQEVPLAEEIVFLQHYLSIQKIRFGDALRIDVDVSTEAGGASVPSLFLQPLVENAIRHGISPRASGGTVAIKAHCLADRLHIQVRDDGIGLPENWTLEGGNGLGLRLTKERIEELHPCGDSHFLVAGGHDGGTSVDISFSYRSAESSR